MTNTPNDDTKLGQFNAVRAELIGLAYRMLGDLARAQDMVQEAWLRWQGVEQRAVSPKAYLATVVTRLCLNELSSARARREYSRSDRLPEPVDLGEGGLSQLERLDQISMACLVVLQRLNAAERAVLLLHDVFELEHAEVAALLDKSPIACRKLLERARASVRAERDRFTTSNDEHERLLQSFLHAAASGNVQALRELLATDAVLTTDTGTQGRVFRGVRNLTRPLRGSARVAAFVARVAEGAQDELQIEQRELNGAPAVVFWQGESAFAALLIAVSQGKIEQVYFHADPARLCHLGPRR